MPHLPFLPLPPSPRPPASRSWRLCGLALVLCAAAARADDAADVRALLARGEAPAALALAEKATAARPRDVSLRFLHGVVLMDLRRDDEALTHFASMAQDYPELPDPFNNMALLHVRAGRLEPARMALEAALRNDPGHRIARANLGQVHLLLALQAMELAAASAPADAALQRRLQAVRALLAEPGVPAR